MKTLIVIKYVFATIGLAMLIGAVWSLKSTITFLNEASTTDGVVTELIRSQSSDSTTYSPVVKFETTTGQEVEYTGLGSNPPSYKVGEIVTVYYREDDPYRAKISGYFSLWGLATILGGMGIIFFGVGGGWLAHDWRRARLVSSLKKTGTPVLAEIIGVDRNTSLSVSGRNPYIITAQWHSPYDNKVYVFKSENLWFDPTDFVKQEHVTVFIDQNDPSDHYLDVSFLPEQGD